MKPIISSVVAGGTGTIKRSFLYFKEKLSHHYLTAMGNLILKMLWAVICIFVPPFGESVGWNSSKMNSALAHHLLPINLIYKPTKMPIYLPFMTVSSNLYSSQTKPS